MAQERLSPGTEVDIYIRGTISSRIHTQNGDTYGVMVGPDQQWGITLLPGMAKIRRATPPHLTLEPGQVWAADGIRWMAQLRREDLPIRLSPQDMSTASGRKTLTEDEFFQTYPDAQLVLHAAPQSAPKADLILTTDDALAGLREKLGGKTDSRELEKYRKVYSRESANGVDNG